jgi:putative MATE family efflux protein
MRFSVVVMAAFFCILSVFPEELTRLFSPDRAIIAEGVAYLSIVKYTYLIFGFTSVLLATLRSMKIVSIALVLSTAAFAINVFLNWILIYGNLGASAMGAKGAAIATLIARVAELIILLFYIIKKGGLLKVSLKSFFHINKDISKDYFRICLPVIFMQSLWGLNNAVQTAILGQTSSAAITANSMASNLFLLVKIGAVGAASAANVMIGHAIGMGNIPEVKKDAKRFQIIFLVIGLLSTLILFVLIEPILSLYSFSRESADLSRQFLYILCFVIFGMSYQMPVNAGIIKGSGDMKYFVKLDLISIWGIVIPVSFLLAFVAKAPPVVVVASLNADQIFKCLPAFIKVNYGSWIKKLTRDEA